MANVITSTKRAFLMGLREDGSPTCHPMSAVMIGDEPSFNGYRKSAKIRNFIRDPRAALVLLENWQVPPSTADVRQGVVVETEKPEPPNPETGKVAQELVAVPESVKQRVSMRLDAGKRIYFRFVAKS